MMRKFSLVFSFLFLSLSACVSNTETKEVATNTAEIYFQLGVRYLNLNKLEVAKENLQRAIELDSKNAPALNALAFLYEKLDKFDEARTNYQAAITLSPEDLSVQNNYGRFLCEQGEAQKGMALLTQATNDKLNERPWLAMTNLGRCYMKLAQYEQAQTYFEQALQLNQNYSPALLEMQKVHYQQGDFISAKVYLNRYAQQAEQTPESLLIAAQIEGASGNAAMAKHYQTLLLTKFPLSAEAKRFKAVK